jgi:hypothetical protein
MMLSNVHRLPDGTRVRLRLARPSDLRALAAFLGSDTLARRYCFYHPRERMILAASVLSGSSVEIIGLADVGPHDVETVTARDDVAQLLFDAAEELAIRRAA